MIVVETDILIDAAHSIEDAVNCLQLISKNQKDYRFIEQLDLLEYPLSLV